MRTRIGEGRIDDLRLGNTVEQLAGTNGRVSSSLTDLALIGHCVEFAQIAENLRGEWEGLENARRRIARRDQPVRTRLIEVTQVRHLLSAPCCIEKATNLLQARDAVPYGVVKRSQTAEQEVVIGLCHPTIGQL